MKDTSNEANRFFFCYSRSTQCRKVGESDDRNYGEVKAKEGDLVKCAIILHGTHPQNFNYSIAEYPLSDDFLVACEEVVVVVAF